MENRSGNFLRFLELFLIIGAIFLVPTVSYAAEKGNKSEAVKLIQSAQALSLHPFEQTRFGIGFKNTSGAVWKAGDPKALILRSRAKKESYFYHSSWLSSNKVMKVPQDTKNGELVYFWFTLEAPVKEGTYQEEFALYRGAQKIAFAAIPITVKKMSPSPVATAAPSSVSVPPSVAPTPSVVVRDPSLAQTTSVQLRAVKLITSAQSLIMKQYERTTFRIGFKNTSGILWKAGQQPVITLRSKASKESYFYDSSWISGNTVMTLPSDVHDGEIAYFDFTLFAPIFPRAYQENLSLYVGNSKIAGSDVSIPITVVPASTPILTTAPAELSQGVTLIETQAPQERSDATVPLSSPARPGIIDDRRETEPFIRVGLYDTTETVRMTANKNYEVRDSEGGVLSGASAGEVTTIVFDFATKLYTISTPTVSVTTPRYVRLRGTQVPYRTVTNADGTISVEPVVDQDVIFEIMSYTNHPAWSTTVNDNMFRGEMEVRYAQATNRLWVVNELLFEQYLKGIAETSNSSPYEYQKALIVAARTYAKYHIDRNSKHADEGFTVKPTEADQVYRGYAAERRLPNVSRAVDETRGVMVYYGDQLAITPYFSQSDGRTRNWEEVWGGSPKPWLVGKPDPMGEADCSTPEKKRFCGHYVGMSARGALAMALDNKGFEEILKYYYTDIELRRKY